VGTSTWRFLVDYYFPVWHCFSHCFSEYFFGACAVRVDVVVRDGGLKLSMCRWTVMLAHEILSPMLMTVLMVVPSRRLALCPSAYTPELKRGGSPAGTWHVSLAQVANSWRGNHNCLQGTLRRHGCVECFLCEQPLVAIAKHRRVQQLKIHTMGIPSIFGARTHQVKQDCNSGTWVNPGIV
jgi:hypothetical protein